MGTGMPAVVSYQGLPLDVTFTGSYLRQVGPCPYLVGSPSWFRSGRGPSVALLPWPR